ncbi:MAG: MbnH family di-heme enzyme, partial [Thermoanaerobaculia bacterium]
SAAAAGYTWELPAGFPRPLVPADNPMTAEKVELGRRLFYDPRLSANGRQACSSCHQQALAFSDGRARAVGATGEAHPRSAMSLTNVAYNASFTWTAPGLVSLERQLRVPLFSRRPVELGLAGAERRLEEELRHDPVLRARFARAFPGEPRALRMANVEKAIAAFERTLISGDSPYDRLLFRDEREALSPAAKRGMELFFSPRLACSRCHGGFNLSGPVVFAGSPRPEPVFHNTNLVGLRGGGRRHGERFRAPTLRNVALTAPYMHDGRLATLGEVVDHYAAGGRPRPPHPDRSPLVTGFPLAPGERDALVAFLESLTDSGFLAAPRFGPPNEGAATARR